MSQAETPKPEKPGTAAPTKKDSTELTDEQMKEISGGPTAVEMPGRITQATTFPSVGVITSTNTTVLG